MLKLILSRLFRLFFSLGVHLISYSIGSIDISVIPLDTFPLLRLYVGGQGYETNDKVQAQLVLLQASCLFIFIYFPISQVLVTFDDGVIGIWTDINEIQFLPTVVFGSGLHWARGELVGIRGETRSTITKRQYFYIADSGNDYLQWAKFTSLYRVRSHRVFTSVRLLDREVVLIAYEDQSNFEVFLRLSIISSRTKIFLGCTTVLQIVQS